VLHWLVPYRPSRRANGEIESRDYIRAIVGLRRLAIEMLTINAFSLAAVAASVLWTQYVDTLRTRGCPVIKHPPPICQEVLTTSYLFHLFVSWGFAAFAAIPALAAGGAAAFVLLINPESDEMSEPPILKYRVAAGVSAFCRIVTPIACAMTIAAAINAFAGNTITDALLSQKG
jgi:hypothetical protein